jgi:hypothetical protein
VQPLIGRLVQLPGQPGLLRVMDVSTLGTLVAVTGYDPETIRVDAFGEEEADAVVVVLDLADLLEAA